jgi:hypothetical protein
LAFALARRTVLGLALLAGLAPALHAEVDLRLFSPAFGIASASFKDSNGDSYNVNATTVEGDAVGLEARNDKFPWLALGTALFVRYDDITLNSTVVTGNHVSGTIAVTSASYDLTSVAPALLVVVYPAPHLEPLIPFVEARVEVYEYADSGLVQPDFERYRPTFSVGVKGLPNETGYFWGARIFGTKLGYSAEFDGLAVPDPVIFGLQVDWIGIQY